ncbi:Hypothetical predicted protein [Mytilus galloprovincialis]|uniref:C2H2-type domain-containing protein n=1 Tax=Mytilus galloprovincialis TaxID=29158 RepID=A0A8B6EVI8_MYTGA|nr:Hypothetical predicted protein [Mytilus galloprovincialis]
MNRDIDDTITSSETTHWETTSDQNLLPLETDKKVKLKGQTCKENGGIGEDDDKIKFNSRNGGQEFIPSQCDQNQDHNLTELINDEQTISKNCKQNGKNAEETIYSKAGNSTNVHEAITGIDVQLAGNSTNLQKADNSTNVQQACNITDVRQAGNSTDVKQPETSTDVKQPETSTDVQQPENSNDVQQAHNNTDAQQAITGIDSKQACISTDAQQAITGIDVQPADISIDVQQACYNNDLHQTENSNDVKQEKNSADVQLADNSNDVKQEEKCIDVNKKDNSTDVKETITGTDVQQASSRTDLQMAGTCTDVKQADNRIDVKQAGKSTNVQQPETSTDGKQPETSTDVKEPKTSTDVKQPETSIDVKQPKTSTDVKEPETSTDVKEPETSADVKQPETSTDVKQPETSTDVKQPETSTDVQQANKQAGNIQQQLCQSQNIQQQQNDGKDLQLKPIINIAIQSSNNQHEPSNALDIQEQLVNDNSIQQQLIDNSYIQPQQSDNNYTKQQRIENSNAKQKPIGNNDILAQSSYISNTIPQSNDQLDHQQHSGDNSNNQQLPNDKNNTKKQSNDKNCTPQQPRDESIAKQQPNEQPCDTKNNQQQCHTSGHPCDIENNKATQQQLLTSEQPCDDPNIKTQPCTNEQICDAQNYQQQCHTSENPCDNENNKANQQPLLTSEQPYNEQIIKTHCHTNNQTCDVKNNQQQCHTNEKPYDIMRNKPQFDTSEQPFDPQNNLQQCHITKQPYEAKTSQQQCHTTEQPFDANNIKAQCHTKEQTSDTKGNQHQCFARKQKSDTIKDNQQLRPTSEPEIDKKNSQLQCYPKEHLVDSKDSMEQIASTQKNNTLLGKPNTEVKDNLNSAKTVEHQIEDPIQKDIKTIEEYYNSSQELPIDLSDPNKKSNSHNGILLAPAQVKKQNESMVSPIHSHTKSSYGKMQLSKDQQSYLKNSIYHSTIKDGLQSTTIPNSKKGDNTIHIPKRKPHRNRQKVCDIRDMQELYKTYQQEDTTNFHLQGKDVQYLHSINEQFGKIQENQPQKTSVADYHVMRQLSHPTKQEVVTNTEYGGSSSQQRDSNSENKLPLPIVIYQRQQSENSENSLHIIMDQNTGIELSESTSSEHELQIATDHSEIEKLAFPVKLEIDEQVTNESETELLTNQQSEHGTEGSIQDDIGHKENKSILFVCNTCLREKMTTATFPNGQTLAKHAILVHHPLPNLTGPYFQFTCHTEHFNYYCIPVVQEKLYPCKFGNCTETFTCARLLRIHVTEHHTKKQLVFEYKKCQYRHCERLFASQEARKQHVKEFHIDHSIKREDGYGALWIIKSSPNEKIGDKQGMHNNERIHEYSFQEIRNFFVEVYEVTRIIVSSGDYFVSFCENCAFYDAPRDFDKNKYGKLCKDEKQCDVSYVCREIKSAYGDFIVDINNVKSRMLNSGVLFHDFHFGCCIFIDDGEKSMDSERDIPVLKKIKSASDSVQKSMDSEKEIPILEKIKPTSDALQKSITENIKPARNELQKSISENIKPKDVEADIGDLVFLYGKPNPNYSPACPETVEDNLESPEGEIIYHDDNDQDNYAVLSCDAFPSELNTSSEPTEDEIDRKDVIKVERYWEEFGDDSIKRSLNISTEDQIIERTMKSEPINEEIVLTENVKQEIVNSGKTKTGKIGSAKSSKKLNMKKPSQTEGKKVHTWKEEEIGSCISIPDSHLVTSDFLSEISENFSDSSLNVIEDRNSKIQRSSDVICDTLEGGSTSIKKDPKSQKSFNKDSKSQKSLNKDSKSQKCLIEDSKSQKCFNNPSSSSSSSSSSALKRSLSVPLVNHFFKQCVPPADKSVIQKVPSAYKAVKQGVPLAEKSVKQREKGQKINDKQNKSPPKCSSRSEQKSAKEEKKETFSKKPYGPLPNIEGNKTNKKIKNTSHSLYEDVIDLKVENSGRKQSQSLLLDETKQSHFENPIDYTDNDDDYDDDIIELDIGRTNKNYVKLDRSQSENDISKNLHHDIIEIDVDHKNSDSRNVYKDDIIVIDTGENLKDMHNIEGHSKDIPVNLQKRKRYSNDIIDLDDGDDNRKSYNESRLSHITSNLNNGKTKSIKTLKSHDKVISIGSDYHVKSHDKVISIDNDDDVRSHDLYTNDKKQVKDEIFDDSDDTDDYTHEEHSEVPHSDFKTKKYSSIKVKEKNWKSSDKTDFQNRKLLDIKRKPGDKSYDKIDHTKKKSQPFQLKRKFCEWKFPKKTNLLGPKIKKETNSLIESDSMQNVCDNYKSDAFQKHYTQGESRINEESTVYESGSDVKPEKEKWIVEGHEIKDCKIKVFKLDDSDVDYICQELKSGHKTNYANYLDSMQKMDARNYDQLMNGCLKLNMKPRRLKRIVEICKKLFEMNKYFHDNPHKRTERTRKRKSNSFMPNGALKKRKSDNNILEFVDLDWIMDSDDSVSVSEDDEDEDTDFDDLDFTDNDLFCPEPGCTKRFASSVTLEHHIARKHDDQSYEERKFCPVENCERSYSNKHNLMTHIKKDHGEVIYNEIRSELYSMKPEPESAMVRPAGTCLMPTVWRNPQPLIPSHVKGKISKTSATEPPKNVKEVQDIKNILSDFTQNGRGSFYSILSNK